MRSLQFYIVNGDDPARSYGKATDLAEQISVGGGESQKPKE